MGLLEIPSPYPILTDYRLIMGSLPLSGTPYCSASDTAVMKQSMRPETVKPHFAVVMKISPGVPSS
jgi:hypothetical protein